MSWAAAKHEALRLVSDIEAQYGRPAEILLTIYGSEAAYRAKKPDEQWPLEFHTQVVRSVHRELLKRGYKARLVTAHTSEDHANPPRLP